MLDKATDTLHQSIDRPRFGKIGFVGLGLMGSVMAENLVASGHSVNAYVRRPEQMDELRGRGLTPPLDMLDLSDCEILISMLPDDNAVRDAFFGSEKTRFGKRKKGTHIRISTIDDTITEAGLTTSAGRCPANGATSRTRISVKMLPAIADWIVTSLTAPNGASTIRLRCRAQA